MTNKTVKGYGPRKVKFLNSGGHWEIISEGQVFDQLPNLVYQIKIDQKGNSYLATDEDFELPSKIYNSDKDFIDFVIKGYERTAVDAERSFKSKF